MLGHPVRQFLKKTDFSDFPVSGSGLPMGHRFRKYISLCWSNSYLKANAWGRRDHLSDSDRFGSYCILRYKLH